MRFKRWDSWVALSFASALGLGGCADADTGNVLGTELEELSVGTATSVAQEFARRDNLPHGLAADRDLVFVSEPLHGRVAVLSRLTGHEIAVLPPPPEGFVLPF